MKELKQLTDIRFYMDQNDNLFMNHELITRLHFCGYPLKRTDWQITKIPQSFKVEGIWYLLPALSELIEKCGNSFFDLRRQEDGFCAYESRSRMSPICGFGLTPEEAVANLWLSINKK